MRLSRRGLLATGASFALPAAARAQERTDAEIIEELLVLEGRLIEAYGAALRREAIEPGLGETLRDQEREHVRGLEQALAEAGGGSPSATVPSPALATSLRSPRAFAAHALTLERNATAAYIEAASAVRRQGLREPLGSIMACEAAHQVALRAAAGQALAGVG